MAWPMSSRVCGCITSRRASAIAPWFLLHGLMVAYAAEYRDEVSHLVVMDASLPGTAVFDRLRADPRGWHFAFHGVRDVQEMLVAGRERQMRAGFELYRAFDRDSEDNRATHKRVGKLTIPVLAVGGAISTAGPLMGEMMREVAEKVREFRAPRTGHWIAEENPDGLMKRLRPFLGE